MCYDLDDLQQSAATPYFGQRAHRNTAIARFHYKHDVGNSGKFAIGRMTDEVVLSRSGHELSPTNSLCLHQRSNSRTSKLRILRDGVLIFGCLVFLFSTACLAFFFCHCAKSYEGMRWIYGGKLPFVFASLGHFGDGDLAECADEPKACRRCRTT